MRPALLVALAAVFLAAPAQVHAQTPAQTPAQAPGQRCRIADPTGTPLNVRAKPNGAVVDRLQNGRPVALERTDRDPRGRLWAEVSDYESGDRLGWVFRDFVSCP